jgi:hypothetical protein
MKELQQTNSLNQSYVMEQKIRKLEKSLAEMKAKLGIEVIDEEPETPKSPITPPITKKSVELQLPSKEPKSPKAVGVQFKHMVTPRPTSQAFYVHVILLDTNTELQTVLKYYSLFTSSS